MSESVSVKGRCLCGKVTFEAAIEPRLDACHCSHCRRLTAGPFMAYGAHILTVQGEEAISRFKSSEWAHREFCKHCGTNLFWRLEGGGHISINAFAIDNPPEGALTTEIFVDEQPDCYRFAGETTRMTGADIQALFAGGN
ncbi:MAG: GFA family protein [Pseudomonadota bacterium]